MGKGKRTPADVRWKGEPQCLLICSSFSYAERGIRLSTKQYYPPQGALGCKAEMMGLSTGCFFLLVPPLKYNTITDGGVAPQCS